LCDREGLELEVTGTYEAHNKVLSSTTALLGRQQYAPITVHHWKHN